MMREATGCVFAIFCVGASACSAAEPEVVGSSEQTLMGGVRLEQVQNPNAVGFPLPDGTVLPQEEVICSAEQRLGLRQSMLLGRTLANSRGFSECIERAMTSGIAEGSYNGPYLNCPSDPFHDSPLAVQIAEVQKRLTTPSSVGITCITNYVPGEAYVGSGAESLWLGAGPPRQAGLKSLESSAPFSYRTQTMAAVAGTIWHETFHNFGYHHSGQPGNFPQAPDICAWETSVSYIMNACAEAVWQGSTEACDQSACTGGRHLAVLHDFNAWEDGVETGLTCDCVSDSKGSPDEGANNPFRTELEIPADPFAGASNADQRFGQAIAVGDFDDDGFDDLAVGIPQKDVGGVRAGAVAVYQGSALGLYPYMLIDQSHSSITNQAGDEFGFAVSAADIDDDGVTDLMVGAPGRGGFGRVYVYRGNAGVGLRHASYVTGNAAGERFGASILPLTIDRSPSEQFFVIGSPGRSVSGLANAGRIAIYAGEVSAGATRLSFLAARDESQLGGARANARFGASLAAGDVIGPEAGSDLLVGAPGADRVRIFDNGDVPDILPSAADFAAWTPALTLEPPNVIGSEYGSAIATGNFDFDSNDEIVVGTGAAGASGEQSVYIHEGSGAIRQRIGNEEPTFGAALITLETNSENTNWDDIVVGAPGIHSLFSLTSKVDASNAVAAFGVSSPISVNAAGSGYGSAFAVGDFDADDQLDLVAGAPTLKVNGRVAGGVMQLASRSSRGANLSSVRKVHDLEAAAEGAAILPSRPRLGSLDQAGPDSWFSGVPSAIIPDLGIKTEGSSSLSFAPGYVEAQSPAFATNDWHLIGSRLLLDAFLPANQPASGWKGNVQVYYSIPSANRYHQYLGQVELGPLANGQWHTVGFDVDVALRSTFLEVRQDARFFVVVSTASNAPDRVRIDNLRFGGTLVAHPQPAGVPTQPAGTGADFVCQGACASATPLGANQHSGAFGSLGEVWYVVQSSVLGWQASEIPGRKVRVNGVQVQSGQMPLPPPVNGKYYFQFTAGAHPWGSFSYWSP